MGALVLIHLRSQEQPIFVVALVLRIMWMQEQYGRVKMSAGCLYQCSAALARCQGGVKALYPGPCCYKLKESMDISDKWLLEHIVPNIH
eukprot:9026176-Ditylum_brightwellii.AAC.1